MAPLRKIALRRKVGNPPGKSYRAQQKPLVPLARCCGAADAELADLQHLLACVADDHTLEGKAAVGCCVLGKLFPDGHVLHDAMESVLRILIDSIYLPEGEDQGCASAFVKHADVAQFLSRSTYRTEFESYRTHWCTFEHQSDALSRAIDLRTKVMGNAISVWQQSTVLRIFTAWRMSIQKRKVHNGLMRDAFVRFTLRGLMQKVLIWWRKIAVTQSIHRTQSQIAENVAVLDQSKAQVELLRTELLEKKSELLTQMVSTRDHVWYARGCTSGMTDICATYEHRLQGWGDLARSLSGHFLNLRNSNFTDQADFAQPPTPGDDDDNPCPFPLWHETTSSALLPWVNGQIRALHDLFPKRVPSAACNVANFSSDWRGGDTLLFLLASLCPPAEAEEMLVDPDRVDACVNRINRLGMGTLCVQAGDIVQGQPDAVLAVVSKLWYTHWQSETSEAGQSSVRDLNIDQCWELFMVLKSEHHTWLQQVLSADDYTLYLATCRAHGTTPRLYTKQEERDFQREQQVYFEFTPQHVPELFQTKPDNALTLAQRKEKADEQVAALASVNQVVQRSFRYVRKAFVHYGSAEGAKKQGSLDFGQFWRLCTECDLIDANFAKPHAAALFADINARNRHTAAAALHASSQGNPAATPAAEAENLTPSKFTQLILRIAVIKFCPAGTGYSKGDTQKIVYAVKTLLEEHIIPKAGMTIQRPSDFRTTVWSEPVQAALRKQRVKTTKVFNKYASESAVQRDDSAVQTQAQALTLAAVVRMLSEGGLVGKCITADEVAELFKSSQNDDDAESMVISEFEEFLAGLAAFCSPSPFEPLTEKISSLVDTYLAPLYGSKASKKGKKG